MYDARFAFTLLALAAASGGTVATERHDRFFEQVKPLLVAKCVTCHGPDKQKAGLRLDTLEMALRGGDNGPALKPGKPDASLLLRAIRHVDGVPAMPPKETLSDAQIAALAAWVKDGAAWPAAVRVLFEDEESVLNALAPSDSGSHMRIITDDRREGRAALAITGQGQSVRVSGWEFPIRENPGSGEYRYLRFAWKKRGGGAIMLEAANNGEWRTQHQTNGAWVAGRNTTGWNAHAVAARAPEEWTVVTRDLWADGGKWKDFTLTGLGITAIDGGEALIDSIILGPSLDSLDAYRPGRGIPTLAPQAKFVRHGDAWTDPDNPVVTTFKGERLDLWSLKKPKRVNPPAVKSTAWVRNPIDAFILSKLEARGIAPSHEADRRTLIRRLSYDLIGLPPTPEEIDAFVNDPAPDFYERFVDRLLESPHYGERWGRYWLDVVRYADSNGFERDEFRPDMWRYRDYVIRALNADKPFDTFVKEQLAGDEMGGAEMRTQSDADRWIATGFLRLGQFDSTAIIFQEEKRGRAELMADIANTTASAFLGLTYSCCQCHDHKYDPLLQADHYRLRAFFAATKPRDDFEVDFGESAEKIRRQHGEIDALVREKTALQKKLLDSTGKSNEKEALKALVQDKRQEHERITHAIQQLEKKKWPLAMAVVMTDAGRTAPPTQILFQGDYTQPREEVPPGFPSVLDPNPAAAAKMDAPTTGQRLALANWMTSSDNPLTARVIVNRLWQGHFGRGIVATPNDFGYAGARPTHPELLDWLAVELPDRGWSLKYLHRLMVLSATYRQASVTDPAARRLDPENRLFWRQNPRRLDAEATRDALLAVSGKLRMNFGGPPRWPAVAREMLKAQPGILEAIKKEDDGRKQGWYTSPPEQVDVRSIYLVQKRTLAIPFLQPFDLPDHTTSCGCRTVTTVAPQALTLLNSPEVARLARAFAVRVAANSQRGDWVFWAFRHSLGRAPDAEEAALAAALLENQSRRYSDAKDLDADRRALTDLCRALFNLNEFVYVD